MVSSIQNTIPTLAHPSPICHSRVNGFKGPHIFLILISERWKLRKIDVMQSTQMTSMIYGAT